MDDNKPQLDDFHYHEMLDRCSMMMEIIDNNLQQHPVAKLDNEISKCISEAVDKLYEAYQIIGTRY
jgi:hypothetical protein